MAPAPPGVRRARERPAGKGFLGLSKAPNPELGGLTLKVMRDGRTVTVEVVADGAGLVSHAGAALLVQVADTVGLTGALSAGLATAYRTVEKIAESEGALERIRAAHAQARAFVWAQRAEPLSMLTIDGDATLGTAHSEKEKAAGTYNGGYGFTRSTPTPTRAARR